MEKIRVIIVEDEFVIAEDISEYLKSEGYDVLSVFNNAEDALAFALENPTDILLVDIKLSGKMEGIDLVKAIRQEMSIPVIYITANSDKSTYERAKETRPQAFLIKPFSYPNLLSTIDLALYNFSEGHIAEDISREIKTDLDEEHLLLNQHLFVRSNGRFRKLNPDDLLFIEASGSYVHLQAQNARYTLSQNLTTFHKKNPLKNLVRVHRSYLINLNKVDSFEDAFVFIQNHKIPLGDHYKIDFLKKIHCL